jgi:hypothetical protein
MKFFFQLIMLLSSSSSFAVENLSFCKTTLKAGLHGVIRDTSGKIVRRTPLGRDPVIVDTNIVISIEQTRYFPNKANDSMKGWAARFHKMMKKRGSHDEPHIYIAERSAKERFVNDEVVTFPDGTRIFEIEGSRKSAEYKKLILKLEEMKVGQVKDNSENDREIIADLFFAKKNYPDSKPTIVTGDAGLYGPLCRLNPKCVALNGDKKRIRELFQSGFDVSLDVSGVNRTVRIVPF